jgi:hypothetical protein
MRAQLEMQGHKLPFGQVKIDIRLAGFEWRRKYACGRTDVLDPITRDERDILLAE